MLQREVGAQHFLHVPSSRSLSGVPCEQMVSKEYKNSKEYKKKKKKKTRCLRKISCGFFFLCHRTKDKLNKSVKTCYLLLMKLACYNKIRKKFVNNDNDPDGLCCTSNCLLFYILL